MQCSAVHSCRPRHETQTNTHRCAVPLHTQHTHSQPHKPAAPATALSRAHLLTHLERSGCWTSLPSEHRLPHPPNSVYGVHWQLPQTRWRVPRPHPCHPPCLSHIVPGVWVTVPGEGQFVRAGVSQWCRSSVSAAPHRDTHQRGGGWGGCCIPAQEEFPHFVGSTPVFIVVAAAAAREPACHHLAVPCCWEERV